MINKIKNIYVLPAILGILMTHVLMAENPHEKIPDFENSGNIKVFYKKLASNLRNSVAPSEDAALKEIAASYAQFQLEELEKVNPRIRRLTRFEISLWNDIGRSERTDVYDDEGVVSSAPSNGVSGIDETASPGSSSLKLSAKASKKCVSLLYKNRYFSSDSTYHFNGDGLNIKLYRDIMSVKGAVEFNSSESRLETTAEKNINKNLRVQISASKNFRTSENFAGVNLNLGF